MKKLLFPAGIFICIAASAQQSGAPYLRIIPPQSNTNAPDTFMAYNLNEANPVIAKATLSHILVNGSKVYILPQDNMPCVVPDTSPYHMPVVKPEISPYTIPNPAYPQNGQPNISPEQLQELLNKYKPK